MTEGVRVRLLFESRNMLSKSQRLEGLKRSWILLKPELEAISDLADCILRVFDLEDVCPNGLVLSMDGFVLPPFESACILKDKDVICVKKKRVTSDDIIAVCDGVNTSELEEVPDDKPMGEGMKLLTNEEFELETGGYESEPEEDEPDKLEDILHLDDRPHLDDKPDKETVSKKRKALKKLNSPKRKRNKCAAIEESRGAPKEPNDIQAEQNGSFHNCSTLPVKSYAKKDKSAKREADYSSDTEIVEKTNTKSQSKLHSKGSSRPQENGKNSLVLSEMPDGTEKLPSRSSRRKKARRRWLRENAGKKEPAQRQIPESNNQHSSGKNNLECAEQHQQPSRCNSGEDEIVPVVIRPGHIRFEPLSKVDADQAIQRYETPTETIQWNGITNKRKGQKWGTEKSSFSKRSDQKNLNEESAEMMTIEEELHKTVQWNGITNKRKGQKWGTEKSSFSKRSDHKNLNEESAEMMTIEEEPHVNVPIDFEKLKPCTSLPKIGDQVAYRLIELSSSWTPELSSFRVGIVLSYDPESNKILLDKVPEYPNVFEEIDEASAAQPSLYREDGSLEIDYTSLVDVRIVKHGNLNTPKAVTSVASEVSVGDQSTAWDSWPKNNEETQAPREENGSTSAWDEISAALNAKKNQLFQDDDWSKKQSSSRSSWSYRGLRGSALGPTMALLRNQNGL
ncbi:hypothetical protein FNV43_RR25905 [Rhamnella rubrinervis]|uniref:Coilin n=1 Tax=Rhamnella rubrinervis TaxID=2594499 RepID=A0A8K0DNT2_9ROSA|nr:hypothetical protein FNV43_RR25905 [Rhamnella rubrinervis]